MKIIRITPSVIFFDNGSLIKVDCERNLRVNETFFLDFRNIAKTALSFDFSDNLIFYRVDDRCFAVGDAQHMFYVRYFTSHDELKDVIKIKYIRENETSVFTLTEMVVTDFFSKNCPLYAFDGTQFFSFDELKDYEKRFCSKINAECLLYKRKLLPWWNKQTMDAREMLRKSLSMPMKSANDITVASTLYYYNKKKLAELICQYKETRRKLNRFLAMMKGKEHIPYHLR